MVEQHTMRLNWEGSASMAEGLKQVASAFTCTVKESQAKDGVRIDIGVVDDDLQSLRDTVDALLVAMNEVEESDSQ